MNALRTLVRPATRRHRLARLSAEETERRALVLRLLSLLFQYPDAELRAGRAALAEAVVALPPSPAAEELAAFTAWFAAEPGQALETHYVETFDLRRRSSLYLTYYLHGDTRRRGMALLTLARTYRAAGWSADTGELPDHLPVVLEFAALAGPGAGEAPLRRHRRGLELIHHALTDVRSPYSRLTGALLSLLPPATEADREAVAKLAAEGPPAEEVGAGPYDGAGFAPPGTFVPPDPAAPTLMPPLTDPAQPLSFAPPPSPPSPAGPAQPSPQTGPTDSEPRR